MFKLCTLICLLFALPAMAEKPVCDSELLDFNEVWNICEIDSDCVEAQNSCGFATAVHTLHLEEAACYFSNIAKTDPGCITLVQPPVKAIVCNTDLKTCAVVLDLDK